MVSRPTPTFLRRTNAEPAQSIRTVSWLPTRAMCVFSWLSSDTALAVPRMTRRGIRRPAAEKEQRNLRGHEDLHERRQGQQRDHPPPGDPRRPGPRAPGGTPPGPVASPTARRLLVNTHTPPRPDIIPNRVRFSMK